MQQKLLKFIDRAQQRSPVIGFTYAVVKKYGDDGAGYYAALLTYYGFLALFPLLLVVTTLTQHVMGNNPELEASILDALTDYFPLLGQQLAEQVDGLQRTGWLLVVGILFALYGTHGVADAFRLAMQRVWQVPREAREGFPVSTLKSLALVLFGGSGLLLASILAGLATAAGRGPAFIALSVTINLIILFWLFVCLIKLSVPGHIQVKEAWAGAAVAAAGLLILQALGGYILAHELRSLSALYSYFAIALGLLFWIYLQAQLIMYAAEISVVHARKFWPRSLDTNTPTAVDKKLMPPSSTF